MATTKKDRKQLRKYLLGGLPETDEPQVEQRLLRDADFAEAFEMVEEELIDQFLRDTLTAKERRWIRQNFLKSPERHQKLRFLAALINNGLNLFPAGIILRSFFDSIFH